MLGNHTCDVKDFTTGFLAGGLWQSGLSEAAEDGEWVALAGHDQHASFGRELVGGNDMEDDNGATDLDIDGDGSGAAGGSGDNAQVCCILQDLQPLKDGGVGSGCQSACVCMQHGGRFPVITGC